MRLYSVRNKQIIIKELVDKKFLKKFYGEYKKLIDSTTAKHKKVLVNNRLQWVTIAPARQLHNIRVKHRINYSVIQYDELLKYEYVGNSKNPVYNSGCIIIYRSDLNFMYKKYIELKLKIKDKFDGLFGILDYE